MIPRTINCLKTNSFFLWGARATGKTSYLKDVWSQSFSKEEILFIDLLSPEREQELSLKPSLLESEILGLKVPPSFVVIDEVQKIPKLLDVVHKLIQEKNIKFALTGSGIRKLKRGGANLLAGRALLYKLYPFTFLELGDSFQLNDVLHTGSLPEIFNFQDEKEKIHYLHSYVQVYLKEEILSEQIIRHIDPFRSFLEVAGQCNGMILNYSKIAREAGIASKSCQRYFDILEETLVGFHLPAYSTSIRKQQSKSPKFYLFDIGVARAMSGTLNSKISPSTYSFGNSFEHLVVLEAYRLNDYLQKNYKFSYFRSKNGVEIDLILERGKEKIMIEIKSKTRVIEDDLKSLKIVREDIPSSQQFVLSLDKTTRQEDGILIIHWQEGLKRIFEI